MFLVLRSGASGLGLGANALSTSLYAVTLSVAGPL